MTGASPAAARAADLLARSAACAFGEDAGAFFAAPDFAVALPFFFAAGRDPAFEGDVELGATSGEANRPSVTERHGVHDEDPLSRRAAGPHTQTSIRLRPHAFPLRDFE